MNNDCVFSKLTIVLWLNQSDKSKIKGKTQEIKDLKHAVRGTEIHYVKG